MGTTEDLRGRVKNVSLCGRLGRIIKVKIQNQKVPKKSESTCGGMVCEENGNGRETVRGRESGQVAGEKKSGLLQWLPKASLVISIATSTLKELIMQGT